MKEKIALGFGNNVDYEIVWDARVFEDFITRYDIRLAELDIDSIIRSERDLVISILSFVHLSSGGERFVATSDIIEQFSRNFDKKVTLGGTSVRAAITMRKFGYTSALHLVTTNEHVRSLIPPDSPYVCSSTQDSTYPHLIVQFSKGDRVKANDIDICASQDNRLIYHSDDDNILMQLSEDFADLITEAKVLLLSGFNAMQDETLLLERIGSLRRIIGHLPEGALVFCEDAGYFDPRYSPLVYSNLPIDIFSLNEDELQGYLNRRLDLLDADQIQQALADLHERIPVPTLVVHTRHWALACGEQAQRLASALRAGVTMATTRYCHGDDFTVADYHAVAQLPATEAAARFADAINTLPPEAMMVCVPVPQVAPQTPTTIGLGDTFVGGFLPALVEQG